VITPEDKKRLETLEKGAYDPTAKADDGMLVDVEDPDGTLVCPEYWCMKTIFAARRPASSRRRNSEMPSVSRKVTNVFKCRFTRVSTN